jgi:hypothetical protein
VTSSVKGALDWFEISKPEIFLTSATDIAMESASKFETVAVVPGVLAATVA